MRGCCCCCCPSPPDEGEMAHSIENDTERQCCCSVARGPRTTTTAAAADDRWPPATTDATLTAIFLISLRPEAKCLQVSVFASVCTRPHEMASPSLKRHELVVCSKTRMQSGVAHSIRRHVPLREYLLSAVRERGFLKYCRTQGESWQQTGKHPFSAASTTHDSTKPICKRNL